MPTTGLLLASALAQCLAQNAHYVLRSDPAVEARFINPTQPASGWKALSLTIDFPKTHQLTWWRPLPGGSDDMQAFGLVKDAEQAAASAALNDQSDDGQLTAVDFIAFDAKYDVVYGTPMINDHAPAHFLMARLGDVMRHRSAFELRDQVPKQLFDFVRCTPNE